MRTIKLCATPPARPTTLLAVIRRTAAELERTRPGSTGSTAPTSTNTKAAFA